MSKQGMARPERTHTKPHNETPPVPEIQGKAKHSKTPANPIIAGTQPPQQKVYHTAPFSGERPISPAYGIIDSDLARDNLENEMDMTAADQQDA